MESDGALAEVQLLRSRSLYFRLDTTPFILIYTIALAELTHTLWKEEGNGIWIGVQVGIIALLHILLELFCHWNTTVKATVRYFPEGDIQKADAIMVLSKGHNAKRQIVCMTRRKLTCPDKATNIDEIGFEAGFQKYIYSREDQEFHKLAYPIEEALEWYMDQEGYKTETEVSAALANWGPNIFEVSIPAFTELLKQQLLAPFFVFQVFCVGLWCMDEYWMYSLFTLFMLVFFECTVAAQRLRNLRHLRSLQSPKQVTNVYRQSTWQRIPGELLLPKDIVSLGRPASGHDEIVIPADLVLLSGSCIVDESVLTGESTPQWKTPVDSAIESGLALDARLNVKRDKAHILFGGTKCLQHNASKGFRIKSPDGGCLAVVVRTGFETAQGHLMGTILHSTETVTANNWETGIFILFLLCFALAASGYVLYQGLQDPERSRFDLLLTCTIIITSVIPPELPMELSIAVNQSLIRLIRKKIFCTEPFRIPFAGKVDVCCFDKTGTLTDDSMILEGVTASQTGLLGHLITPKHLPVEASRILAACHSLVVVEGELVGDPLEKAAIEAIDWSYKSNLAVHPSKQEELFILHRYHFSAQLKRMSTVVRRRSSSSGGSSAMNLALSKGAPEVMFSRFADPPPDYERMYKQCAAQGGRVIALGYRTLDEDIEQDNSVIRGSDREAAESNLIFSGFAVFQCPLKLDSAPALEMLDKSSHLLVMITGDAPLTACDVASRVHIITRPAVILYRNGSSTSESSSDLDFIWRTPDESESIPFDSSRESMTNLAAERDLCITGDSFPYLEKKNLISLVVPLVQVFARVAPEHKEKVVETLRAEGRVVLMCGDGTNDVGGLKAADVGVALLTGLLERAKKLAARKRGEQSRGPRTKRPKPPSRSDNPAMRMIEEMERQGKPVNPRLRKIAELVEELDPDVGLLKPGDASMAAPFTAKKASVMPCTDLIMQGRSTLVSTVQMFKILGLMSLANAYALSVMHLQGVKIGDVQITVTGLLTAGMFFFLSNTEPLSVLSKTRPHPSIFCPYVFLSVLGQSLIHMMYLVYLYKCTVEEMPEEDHSNGGEEERFKPNLVNSVCFLVNFIIQINTFAVNYSGAPFTTPLWENKGLSRSLLMSAGIVSLLVLDIVPGFCSSLEMVFIPGGLRIKILLLGLTDFCLSYGLESMTRIVFPAKLPPKRNADAKKKKEV